MANAPATAPRKTVLDYGLVRTSFPIEKDDITFMEPYVNPTGTLDPAWAGFSVDSKAPAITNTCAVSTALGAYVTMSAFLTFSEEVGADRLTPMRLRDIIIDTYLAAGGSLETLRFVGTKGIINIATRRHAEQLFRRAGKDITQQGSVEFWPWDEAFASASLGNPFSRCIHGLLRDNQIETGHAKIKRFIFLSLGLPPGEKVDDIHPIMDLVIEICRPGENGYVS
ncbi:hypothetical protein F4859DRAFT_528728 [Xylaria cf. heliscus]|nr:hypothetical protein F4859DRAFT_528728 [Xylaria cf. heliscus]